MTCARYRALISRYLDDELSPHQRAELLAHIEHCASCAADLARYRQGELLLRKLPEGQPKPELKRAVLREARRVKRRPGHRLIWLLSAGGRARPRLVLTALAIVVLLPVAAGLALDSAARRAIGAPFGFSAPTPSPTVPYLDVPASATPPPPGPLSAPHMVATFPYDGADKVDPHSTLLVGFDQPMDRRSVERAFQIEPPAPGAFVWEADNQFRFQPAPPGLLRGVTYTVALTDGAHSQAGGGLPVTAWSFQTLPGPVVQAVYPPAGAPAVPATTTLVLTFSQAIKAAGVEPLVRIEPDTGDGADAGAPAWTLHGHAAWSADGQVLHFTPEAALPPETVRVTLGAGAQDKAGDFVPPASWTFAVAPPDNVVTFDGPRLRALAPGDALPTISYNAPFDPDMQMDAVHFALYPLPESALAADIPWLLDPAQAAAGLPWPPVLPAGQAAIRTWSGPVRRGGPAKSAGNNLLTTIPIHEPGLYLLTASMAGGRGDQRLLALGADGVVLWMSGGRWWAWVSDLRSGQAAAGAQVRFYDAAGGLLATTTTDGQGLASASLAGGQVPVLALAEDNGNIAIAQAAPAVMQQAAASGNNALGATVILDRPRYQPGDTVLFSALVRPPSVDLAGTAVGVHLRDPAGRDFATLTLQPDAHGAINGAFPLAPDLAPGAYGLVLSLGDYAYYTAVPLDAASAPPGAADLNLSLATPLPVAYAGDTITATIRADYGPGRPAAGLTVSLSVLSWDADGGSAGAPPAGPVLTATVDENGMALVPLHVPAWDPEDAPGAARTYQLLLQAADTHGRRANALDVLDVRAGHALVEQTLQKHIFAPGVSTVVSVTVRDEAGRPLAGQVVSTGLYTPRPPPDDITQSVSLLDSVTSLSDADGVATATLALPLQGVFAVRSVMTDSAGTLVSTAARIWVYKAGSTVSWTMPVLPPPGVTLTADRDSYAPGETAQVFVEAHDGGGGLLVATVSGQVVGVQAVSFRAGGGIFNVPIPPDTGAAAGLDVRFLRFTASDGDPHLLAQTIALPLRPPADLALSLPDAPATYSYLPGQVLPLSLALHAASPAPGGGEALLRIAPVTPEPASAAESALFPAASGPARDTDAAEPPAATAPTAYWGPDLPLDGSGQLSTTVRLPDRPGIWSLDAWAFTAGGVSHTRRIVRITAPIDVQWSVPATLVQGDSTSLGATITNNQPAAANLDVRVEVDAGTVLALAGPAGQVLRLAPGESRTLAWPLRAVSAGSAQISLDIAGGSPDSPVHRQQIIAVSPYGVSAAQTHAGTVLGSETINMTLPPDVDPASATLEIHAAPTLPGVLADTVGAQTLPVGAERGPVAAAAARLVAAAALQALYTRQGRDPGDLPAGLAESNRLDLQYLYLAQQPDGVWGAWPDAPPDAASSVLALQALWELSHDGSVTVDADTVRRGLAWLQGTATAPGQPGFDGAFVLSAADAPQAAAALYVLSLFGPAPPGALDRLLAAEPRLAARERAFLALALARNDRGAAARLLVDRLAAAASDQPDPVVLEALLSADPASFRDATTPLASALLAARTGATWNTPATTAAAVLALSHYAAVVPEAPSTGSYRILLNGQVIREVVVGPGKSEAGSVVVTVPSSRLHTGDNPVGLEATGLRLYYSLRAQALLNTADHPIPSRQADGAPLGLLRVYEVGPEATTTVVLTLTVTTALGASQLDDPLPAGLVRLPGLTATRLDGPLDAPVARDARAVVQSLAADTSGLHVALGPLAPGTYVLTYPAAPVALGTYTALPALFALPGDPTIWARSGSDTLVLDH